MTEDQLTDQDFAGVMIAEEIYNKVKAQRDQLQEKLRIATEALEWIDKPDHFERDQYTQAACFQHRAYEALKKIKGDI